MYFFQAGPAGAHFGLLAALFVDAIYSWKLIGSPFRAVLQLGKRKRCRKSRKSALFSSRNVDSIRYWSTAVDGQLGAYFWFSIWPAIVVGTVALHSGVFVVEGSVSECLGALCDVTATQSNTRTFHSAHVEAGGRPS